MLRIVAAPFNIDQFNFFFRSYIYNMYMYNYYVVQTYTPQYNSLNNKLFFTLCGGGLNNNYYGRVPPFSHCVVRSTRAYLSAGGRIILKNIILYYYVYSHWGLAVLGIVAAPSPCTNGYLKINRCANRCLTMFQSLVLLMRVIRAKRVWRYNNVI